FGFLDASILNVPFTITLSPFLMLNSLPLKMSKCSLASGCSLPPCSPETAFQVPCSLSLSFLSASLSSAPTRVEPPIVAANNPNTITHACLLMMHLQEVIGESMSLRCPPRRGKENHRRGAESAETENLLYDCSAFSAPLR